jgi:hypothetical protein
VRRFEAVAILCGYGWGCPYGCYIMAVAIAMAMAMAIIAVAVAI